MCMNPLKALPYPAGGLIGGSLIKSAFDGKKKNKPEAVGAPMVTQGVTGPSPSLNPYGG